MTQPKMIMSLLFFLWILPIISSTIGSRLMIFPDFSARNDDNNSMRKRTKPKGVALLKTDFARFAGSSLQDWGWKMVWRWEIKTLATQKRQPSRTPPISETWWLAGSGLQLVGERINGTQAITMCTEHKIHIEETAGSYMHYWQRRVWKNSSEHKKLFQTNTSENKQKTRKIRNRNLFSLFFARLGCISKISFATFRT